jgi:uncharacterized protein (TIGR03435 family)
MTGQHVRFVLVTTVVGLVLAGSQQPKANTQSAPTTPSFEVASVKMTTSDQGPRGVSFSPSGRFAWSRMTLRQLMQSAFGGVDFKEIVGGPRWIDSDRFDIVATSPDALRDIAPDGSPRGLFMRLRALLEDRFRLKTHVEQRSVPVYALLPAALPMTPGPDLRKTAIDCEAAIRDLAAGRSPDRAPGQMPPCALRPGLGQLTGHAITMEQVANALAGSTGRPVIDRTGLTGTFDVQLRWAADPPAATINGVPAPATDGPSLFTAVREQLGLKLEATRAEVPVLVIDEAQLPTPD